MKKILGTMRIPQTTEETVEWLKAAHKAGYEWLDLAYIYGGQDTNAIAIAKALAIVKKEGIDFKLQSKIWTTCFLETSKYVDVQLANQGITKFDALLLHRPSIDFNESIEAWKQLVSAKKAGKVAQIGVSNFDNDMIRLLIAATGETPQINQIEHSINYYRPDRIAFANKKGIELQGWSSLGSEVEKNLENPVVKELAKKYNVSESQILLSFSTSMKIATVIGTLKSKNLQSNLDWIALEKADLQKLIEIVDYTNKFEETFPISNYQK